MKSFAFPVMLSNTSANIVEDHEATASNMKLLLGSDKGSLFGDPYFGTRLRSLLFSQNSVVLKDLTIDDIYTAIVVFMPQVVVKRKDIKIRSDKTNVYAEIKCLNLLDYTTDIYNINLTQMEQQ